MVNYTKEQLAFINKVSGAISVRKRNTPKEDLTIDGYIKRYGGIESHVDNKIYTTKKDYLGHLKDNNCHIKDY